MTVIAVIGAGAMGSGIGRLLVEGGASVITNLDADRRHEKAGR